LGLTRSRVAQWPDVLTLAQEDRVLGAALRLGKIQEHFGEVADRA